MTTCSIWLAAVVYIFTPCAAFMTRSERDMSRTIDRPVSRVVKLLKAMKVELEKDAEADQEIYDKVKCWCIKNVQETTKSISEAEARINDLFSTVKEAASKRGQLQAEIKGLQDQVTDMKEELKKATEIREKESALFTEEEQETMQAVKALKSAIAAIQKQHAAIASGNLTNHSSLISTPNMKKVLSMVRMKIQSHGRVLLASAKPHEQRILKAFMQSPGDDDFEKMVQSSAPKQTLGLLGWAPESGQIYRILTTMLHTFEENLSDSTQKEMSNREEFEAMKENKEKEMASCEGRIAKKQEELADYGEESA